MKERDLPKHEFIILRTKDDHYCIERRPPEGTDFNSKLDGCTAEDTITRLERNYWNKVRKRTAWKILVLFRADPKPDLYTVFGFCNAIRKDPDAKKYTLLQFNCYFFARTLMLLITRHFLSCRIHKSPRNNFDSLPGPGIDASVDKATNKMPDRVFSWIGIILFNADVRMILLKF